MTIDTASSSGTGKAARGSQVLSPAFEEKNGPSTRAQTPNLGPENQEGSTLTRALRSHQLWLTVTYLGLLGLMARGFAS